MRTLSAGNHAEITYTLCGGASKTI